MIKTCFCYGYYVWGCILILTDIAAILLGFL